MRAKITLRLVSGLMPGEKNYFVWDVETKGFGLKLTAARSIIYLVQTRLGGRLKRYTIGRHGVPWTPNSAQREAIQLLGRIAEGDPPASQREEKRKALTVPSSAISIWPRAAISRNGRPLQPIAAASTGTSRSGFSAAAACAT